MSDKRMMVLPVELVDRVDENRGDVSRAEFINLLLDNHLGNGEQEKHQQQENHQQFVTSESLAEFEGGMKELLRSFLEFFITYGLEIGKGSGKADLEALSETLKESPDLSVSARHRRTVKR